MLPTMFSQNCQPEGKRELENSIPGQAGQAHLLQSGNQDLNAEAAIPTQEEDEDLKTLYVGRSASWLC